MNAYSEERIAQAIADVPTKGNRQLESLLERARKQRIEPLLHAIEAELLLRGRAVALSDEDARKHFEWHQASADLGLAAAISLAFTRVPPVDYELPLIKAIAAEPGISYQALEKLHGKGDVGLILGHLVYDRLGFFRRFLGSDGTMSDLILQRSKAEGKMCYALSAEAQDAFFTIGLI